MATTKKSEDITIEEQTIIVQRTITDPSLIKFDEHKFTLADGTYHIHIDHPDGWHPTRIIDVTEPTDPVIVEQSGTGKLIGDFTTPGNRTYLIQFLDGRQWQPLQTLPPHQYNVVITQK